MNLNDKLNLKNNSINNNHVINDNKNNDKNDDSSETKQRKYNSEFRKKLVLKMNKIKNKNDFIHIFNIIEQEVGKDFSVNKNGIFFNVNSLTDHTIYKINEFLSSIFDSNNTETESKIIYSSNENDIMDTHTPKLSNQEKQIVKKIF